MTSFSLKVLLIISKKDSTKAADWVLGRLSWFWIDSIRLVLVSDMDVAPIRERFLLA
jgi:hypothetical protein